MSRNNIIVVGFPRSGTTWLCRLIADAWDCPIGSIHSPKVFQGHATEGMDRQGPFVVLHGHKPASKMEKKDGDFIFFIYRDPRDVIVSTAFYFDIPLDQAIKDVTGGRVDAKGPRRFPMADYVKAWLDSGLADYVTKYEDLHRNAAIVLCDIMDVLDTDPVNDFVDVVHRQSFEQRKKWTEDHGDELTFGKEYHLRFMRQGIVGDWQNHLSLEQQQCVETRMDGLGYW